MTGVENTHGHKREQTCTKREVKTKTIDHHLFLLPLSRENKLLLIMAIDVEKQIMTN